MRSFATLAALAAGTNALVPRNPSGCCFHLTASGGASGPVGQLDDGQNRVGGDSSSLPEGQFCIDSDGSITDGNGRGCILTPPTTQLQCDVGATPTPGFSVNSNGQLTYNGNTDFVACATGQNGEMNIYTTPDEADVSGCVHIQLSADSCSGSGSGGGGAGPSGSGMMPSSSMPVNTPSASAPGGGGGQGATPSPSMPGGGSGGEGPSQSTMTVPVIPGGGSGGGSGGQGSMTAMPSGPGTSSGDCSMCLPTSTLYTTITVDCSETSVPGGGAGGEQPTGPAGGGETPSPSMPAGGGETPTMPAGGGETPTMPAGGGETPSPSMPAGGGETPTGPSGGGQTQPPTSTEHCPASLSSGAYETPHLIVPVDSSSPDQSYGTQYNGSVSSTVSSIFNFDIPQSDEGKTCSLVFLFPKQEDLETSAFTFSGDGSIQFSELSGTASQSTSYSNAPGVSQDLGSQTVSPGNSYVVSTFSCPAGESVAYEMSTSGSTDLEFFEDWNPSPLGLFITTC